MSWGMADTIPSPVDLKWCGLNLRKNGSVSLVHNITHRHKHNTQAQTQQLVPTKEPVSIQDGPH